MAMHRVWTDLGLSGVNIPPNTSITPLDILFDAVANPFKTVTRLIIDLTARIEDLALNVDGIARVSFGIGVASEEAFAAGAGSLPLSSGTSGYPPRGWLWVAQREVIFSNSSTHGIEAFVFPHFEADLRANRKIDKGILYLTSSAVAVFGDTFDVEISGRIRALTLQG